MNKKQSTSASLTLKPKGVPYSDDNLYVMCAMSKGSKHQPNPLVKKLQGCSVFNMIVEWDVPMGKCPWDSSDPSHYFWPSVQAGDILFQPNISTWGGQFTQSPMIRNSFVWGDPIIEWDAKTPLPVERDGKHKVFLYIGYESGCWVLGIETVWNGVGPLFSRFEGGKTYNLPSNGGYNKVTMPYPKDIWDMGLGVFEIWNCNAESLPMGASSFKLTNLLIDGETFVTDINDYWTPFIPQYSTQSGPFINYSKEWYDDFYSQMKVEFTDPMTMKMTFKPNPYPPKDN